MPKTFPSDPLKAALRQRFRSVRRAIAEAERARQSEQASAHAAAFIGAPTTVALYASRGSELDTAPLAARLQGCRIVYPRVDGDQLVFAEAALGDLVPGPHGLLQPRLDLAGVPSGEIDVVVVPGLAFSRGGDRLGQGGGYYDRFLALCVLGQRVLGLAFSEQVVDSLPRAAHDVPVDAIATPDGVIVCHRIDRTQTRANLPG